MKRLAVFLDGTWNDPESRTNVSRLHGLVSPLDETGTEQRSYYDTGVGTKKFEKLRGGVGAYGLSKNVRQAYAWLMANYQADDEIYLFGFSRGAFTARSVGGLIARYGLLQRDASVSVDELWELYCASRPGETLNPSQHALRDRVRHNRVRINVRFLGLWDTVGTLGIPFGNFPGISRRQFRFHHTRPSRFVDAGCQALALDEHRKAYDAVLWTNFLALDPATDKIADPERRAEVHHPGFHQRWFAGVHSNVGGGYSSDDPLALPPLAWVQQEASRAGLSFEGALTTAGDGYVDAPLADSFKSFMKGFYRILRFGRRHYRTVGRPLERKTGRAEGLVEVVNESIDGTVIERWQGNSEYRPKNLAAWAERVGVDLGTLDPGVPLRVKSQWRDWV